jgi:mevalonate kinase
MIDHYFDLQKKLGVIDEQLEQMIELASQSQNTLAAKISGAGLGDCVLVIGEIDKHLWRSMQDIQMIEVHTVEQGVEVC